MAVTLAVTCTNERDGWIHPDLAIFLLNWLQRHTGVIHFVRNYRPHHNAPGRFVNPIATLPGPLLNSSNGWMVGLMPGVVPVQYDPTDPAGIMTGQVPFYNSDPVLTWAESKITMSGVIPDDIITADSELNEGFSGSQASNFSSLPSPVMGIAFSWSLYEEPYAELGETANVWEQKAIETMINRLVQSETYVGEYASEAEQLANEGVMGGMAFFTVGLGMQARLYDDYNYNPGNM